MTRADLLAYLSIQYQDLLAEAQISATDDAAGLGDILDRTFAWLGVAAADLPSASTNEDESAKPIASLYTLERIRDVFGQRVDFGTFEEQDRRTGLFGQVSALITDMRPRAELAINLSVHSTEQSFAIADLEAGNNGPVTVGNPITFTASQSAGTWISYRWDFGDGNGGMGASVAHTYADAGTYTATVIASNDSSSATAMTSATVTV